MNKDNLDTETSRLIAEAEALSAMFSSSGWAVAERAFNELISDLRNIETVDIDGGDISQQVRDRINTASMMRSWLADLKSRVNSIMNLHTHEPVNSLVERIP